MSNPYQIMGHRVAVMRGREKLFEQLCRHLTKKTPDHMSVVGPKLFGKSVFLYHVGNHFSKQNPYFFTAAYMDLRHSTPDSDMAFKRRFAGSLRETLKSLGSEIADYLDIEDENLSDMLHLVFEELESNNLKILAIFDGFDHILGSTNITRNLWDEMRTLAQRSSLCIVTGSRNRLRELCRTEESRTSDFWEIFYDTPLSVGCFDENDWDSLLHPFEERNIHLDSSARKEMINWTGGVPILAAALMQRLYIEIKKGAEISKSDVDRLAENAVEDRRELLLELWDDCTADMQSVLADLSGDEILISEVPDARRRGLTERGFVQVSGNRLKISCRLMKRFAVQQGVGIADMHRLFGDVSRFEKHIRGLLELRLSQIRNPDPALRGYVEKAIRDLHPDPAHSIVWARSIAERALDIIWEAELPADRKLPEEWTSNWKYILKDWPNDQGRLPRERGQQCYILRLITGTKKVDKLSKYITKQTLLLVDHLQSAGDFGQHKEERISLGFAASVCYSAIELCENMVFDLKNKRS